MSGDAGFVGSIPGAYDKELGPIIFADVAVDIAKRVAAVAPSNVLETAAGTGIVTRALRDALPQYARLTATDLNAPMLDIAREKFRPGEEVAFEAADALELPYADGIFDAVVCQFGVMFYPDKDKGYREVMRVLSPGGRYFFSVWDGHANNPYAALAHEVVTRLLPQDTPQFLHVPFGYRFEPIKESLVAAGFTDIDVSIWRREVVVPTASQLARGVAYGTPLYEQLVARGSPSPEALHAALIETYQAAFGPDPGRMPIQALLVCARKPQ